MQLCATTRRGFTLIELILVMALMIVVIGLTAPSLANFFRGRDLDSEVHRFLSLTRYAQSRAVSEGVPMLLWVDPDRRTYGLTEEFSYSERDRAAVSYELAKDLQIEVDTSAAGQNPALGFGTAQPQLTQVTVGNRTVPLGRNTVIFRFQPDGFIGETSPSSLWVLRQPEDSRSRRREDAEQAVWITQDENRLNYAIQTNHVAFVRR